DLLVELDVTLELGDGRAGERLDLVLCPELLGDALDLSLEVVDIFRVAQHPRPRRSLYQYLDRAVRQLEQLQHRSEGPGRVDRIGRRIVIAGVLLCRQQDLFVRAHDLFEGIDRLLPPDEQRHDHVGKHDDVAQRQDRISLPTATPFLALCAVAHGLSLYLSYLCALYIPAVLHLLNPGITNQISATPRESDRSPT